MEIVIKNLTYIYKNKKLLNKVNLVIESNKITGITGTYKTLLCEILDGQKEFNGEIVIGEIPLIKDNIKEIRKTVSLITQNYEEQFFTNNVKDEMMFLMSRLSYKPKDINKKIDQSLQIVGLSKTVLNKKISDLSNLEKKLLQISVSLIYNPDIIIFDESLVNLDKNNTTKITRLIKDLKNKYKKTVIIVSNDVDMLYELTDNIVILKKGSVYLTGNTTEVYTKKDLDSDIVLPNLVRFTNLAKAKGVKLSYHKDIRDLIKDVYKHV